ncbi:MAG TPA: hypothetical protein VH374_20345 [Polyangia bacterium]|jgi:hypothetical protein|nr:hypothetical protein [Polyangia bacterium]
MRLPTVARAALALTTLGLAASNACTYSPDFKDGELLCGTGESCPKGYHCVMGHTCWKSGANPSSGSGGSSGTGGADTGGSSGTGGSSVVSRNLLLGTWDFSSGTLTITCSDGTSQSKPLKGPADNMDVSAGSGSTVVADYYCGWILDFNAVGNTATGTLEPGQTCTSSGGCTDFTWMGQSFAFSSSDGATAQVNGNVNATYKDYTNPADPKNTNNCLPKTTLAPTGTCTLSVTGTLTSE